MVSTLSAPAVVKMSANNFAVMGSLAEVFLSCLAYPKKGIMADILFADARLRASIMIRSSNILSLIGSQQVCNTKTSHPRTLSRKRIYISPFENLEISHLPNSILSAFAISAASTGLEVPENKDNFFFVTTSMLDIFQFSPFLKSFFGLFFSYLIPP